MSLKQNMNIETDAGVLHIGIKHQNQGVMIVVSLDPQNGNDEIDIASIRNVDISGASASYTKHGVLKNIRVDVCEYENGECEIYEHIIRPNEADTQEE